MDHREYMATLARLAENEAKIAYNRGKMEAILDATRSDPGLLDLAQKTSEHTGKSVEELFEAALQPHLPAQPAQPEPAPDPTDPLVAKFRSMLGE